VNVRPLVIDDALKAECARLRIFAEDPKNWYVIGETKFVPGDRPEYVIRTAFGFRVVFTITHALEHRPEPIRHMTISVSGKNYPNPMVVFTLAHYLGFTGASVVNDVVPEPGPWAMAIDDGEHCIIVQQAYEIPDVH